MTGAMATHMSSRGAAQDPPPQPCLQAAAEGRLAIAIILPRALPGWDPAAARGEIGGRRLGLGGGGRALGQKVNLRESLRTRTGFSSS
jgi:hypothetical protein